MQQGMSIRNRGIALIIQKQNIWKERQHEEKKKIRVTAAHTCGSRGMIIHRERSALMGSAKVKIVPALCPLIIYQFIHLQCATSDQALKEL